MRLIENRRATSTSKEYNHHSSRKIVHNLNRRRKARPTKRESVVQIQAQGLKSTQIIDFRGTDKAKPEILSEASPGAIVASCPLLASSNVPRLKIISTRCLSVGVVL